MNKNQLLGFLTIALLTATVPVQLCAQSLISSPPLLSTTQQIVPALAWKYGPNDGKLANTIGSAANHNPLPAGTTYLSAGYIPSQIAHAYGFDKVATNGDGRGVVIAIVDAYGSPNIQSDLNKFDSQYGLTQTTIKILYPDGMPTNNDSGWAGETTLDVEWAHAMAPGATIYLVVAPNSGQLYNTVNYIANTKGFLPSNSIISMSWGGLEFTNEKSFDGCFTNPSLSFVAASGDYPTTNYPAASPFVLGVGGTTMIYDTTNNIIISETGWNGSLDTNGFGPGYGGGGGISQYETLPSYQARYNANSGRGIPDVVYDADPYTGFAVYFTDPTTTNAGTWSIYGGTSAGAPQWAALQARRVSLINTPHPGTLAPTYSNLLPYIYITLGYTVYPVGPFKTPPNTSYTGYTTLIRDIILGNNGVWPATTAYDLATGLGSPVANNFAIPSGTSNGL